LAVEPLIAALSHETAGVREDVATALGQTQDRRAVDPLVAAMSNGSPGSVRHAAVRSLGQIGDIRAVSPLIAALLHRDTEVQRLARIALDALEPNWPQGDTASAIVPDLIDAMTDERFLHADSLVASLDRIDAAWRENESITQAIPGYIATYIGPVTSTESARRSDMAERVLFAISFRWQQSDAARHAVPDFIASLRLSVSGFHRGDMARDLGQIGDPLAVEPLIEALRDKETTVRWSAAESLGRLGDRRAIDPLIAALADDDDFVRRRAAEALGAIGDPRAAAPLAAAMKDVATAVQKAAAAALDQLDWQREQ
jgi:HEAT repeat protein